MCQKAFLWADMTFDDVALNIEKNGVCGGRHQIRTEGRLKAIPLYKQIIQENMDTVGIASQLVRPFVESGISVQI